MTDRIRIVAMNEMPISKRLGDTLLERMQQVAGMPYHAPTLQFHRENRGRYTDFTPHNLLATALLAVFRVKILNAAQLEQLEAIGFSVEVRE